MLVDIGGIDGDGVGGPECGTLGTILTSGIEGGL
jgi:hypothetical protein